MATNYNVGIRSALNKQGINNNRIGYNNGYVTVDGKNFLQAGANKGGTAYTSQSALNTALKSLTPASGQTMGTGVPIAVNAARPVTVPSQSGKQTVQSPNISAPPTYTPPVNQTQQTLQQLSQQLAKNQQFQFKAPQAFSYNENDLASDPQYQSQLRLAQRAVTRQQGDTNAALRAGGQGKSSYSETVANQIGADAMANIADTIVPQLVAQRFNQYQDASNRDMQVQQGNYGIQQDAASGLASLYGLQNQEYFENPLTEAQTTGVYQSTPVREAVNQLMSLKQQAEAKGVTKEQRTALSAQADQVSDFISSQGVDTSNLGANTTSSKINTANIGIRTLQGQQFDQQAQTNRFNQAITVGEQSGRLIQPQMDASGLFRQAANPNTPLNMSGQNQAFNQAYQQGRATAADQQFQQQFGYQQERDQVGDQQWAQQFEYQAVRALIGDVQFQQQFDEDVRRYGIDSALNRQVQLGSLSFQDAQNAREQGKYDAEMASSGQVNVNEIASKYLDPVIKVDPDTGLPVDQEAAKRQIASLAGADGNLAAQLYLRYGMKPPGGYSPQQ